MHESCTSRVAFSAQVLPAAPIATAPMTMEMPAFVTDAVAFITGPALLYVGGVAAAVMTAKITYMDPVKDDPRFIVSEGRLELKPVEEEEEEDYSEKVFELPEDGKKYGGAFMVRADLVEKLEKKASNSKHGHH